jgi:hypothetical protein
MTDKLRFRLTVDSETAIFLVNKVMLLTQLGLFQEHPSLLDAEEYTVKSIVSPNIFEQFVEFLEGASIDITLINFSSLRSLSKEFAVRSLESACASFAISHQESMNLENDDDIAQDLIRAAEYYRLSAEQGNSDGQDNFGFCLFHGRGVAQDLIRAAEYYRLSAEQGNSSGQNHFGLCLATGRGVAQDLIRAAEYYRLSAEQ